MNLPKRKKMQKFEREAVYTFNIKEKLYPILKLSEEV